MIDLMKRPEGTTVEQIAAATGWQHHTIRGVISGALKKKLGLTVEATRTREVGPNKTGAKGSSTVYRIVGWLSFVATHTPSGLPGGVFASQGCKPICRPCSVTGARRSSLPPPC